MSDTILLVLSTCAILTDHPRFTVLYLKENLVTGSVSGFHVYQETESSWLLLLRENYLKEQFVEH